MILDNADIIDINEQKYMVMDYGFYEGKKYAFLNKLDESGEPTNDNVVVEIDDNNSKEVSGELLSLLLTKFVNRLMEKE